MSENAETAIAIIGAFATLSILALMGVFIMVMMAREDAHAEAKERGEALRSATARPAVSGWTLIWRALIRKCPACGGGRIFKSYLKMNEHCSQCGRVFFRNEGEWLGPWVIDYTIATAAGLVVWAILVMLGLSEALQLIIALAAAIIVPLLFAPWSRSFWTIIVHMSGEM